MGDGVVSEEYTAAPTVGVVVIGRNEGERLRRCLESAIGEVSRVVYVDSGSSDDSVQLARAAGVAVLPLDPKLPFSAARARNEGFARLRQVDRHLAYVQFVDGDCELLPGWLGVAARFLDQHPGVAIVSGHLREKYPRDSIYNTLCDIEWDRPTGEAKMIGGLGMVRVDAFERVRGYRIDLIAGEEPELCVRLRALGWKVWQLADEMALHDSALSRFGQWWRRMQRGGYAYAQGASLHGAPPERHGIRESRSALFWGMLLPILAISGVSLIGWWGWLVLAVYPLQVVRLALRGDRSPRENWWRAIFLVIGKFPEALGQLQFATRRGFRLPSRLIEYK